VNCFQKMQQVKFVLLRLTIPAKVQWIHERANVRMNMCHPPYQHHNIVVDAKRPPRLFKQRPRSRIRMNQKTPFTPVHAWCY